jgi:hypothetical protein
VKYDGPGGEPAAAAGSALTYQPRDCFIDLFVADSHYDRVRLGK